MLHWFPPRPIWRKGFPNTFGPTRRGLAAPAVPLSTGPVPPPGPHRNRGRSAPPRRPPPPGPGVRATRLGERVVWRPVSEGTKRTTTAFRVRTSRRYVRPPPGCQPPSPHVGVSHSSACQELYPFGSQSVHQNGRRRRMVGRQQARRGQHVRRVDHPPRSPRQRPAPGRVAEHRVQHLRAPAVPQHPARPDHQAHVAQVPAAGPRGARSGRCDRGRGDATRPSPRPPPAGGPCRCRKADRRRCRPGRASRRRPRPPPPGRPPRHRGRPRRSGTATGRRPRPGAAPSRPPRRAPAPSTRRWSPRPRPPPAPRRRCESASSSTAASTASGVAARTSEPNRGPCDSRFPPITWRRNTSRMAARAGPGSRTPMRGSTLPVTVTSHAMIGQHGRGVRGAPARCRPAPPAAAAAPTPAAGRCAASVSASPPSVPPTSRITSGRAARSGGDRGRGQPARRPRARPARPRTTRPGARPPP